MRFIQVWSYSCANLLMQQQQENHEKRRVYYFGFQVLLGALVKGILLVSVSFLLGILQPTLVVLLVFASLRVFAGGYHMDTYGKCIFTALGLFVIAGLVTKYSLPFWNFIHIIILVIASLLVGLFVLLKWAPRDTPNKPITKQEDIIKYKRQSVVYLVLWGIVTFLLAYKSYYIIVIPACFGLLIELFSVAPVGYKFFDWISGKIGK